MFLDLFSIFGKVFWKKKEYLSFLQENDIILLKKIRQKKTVEFPYTF